MMSQRPASTMRLVYTVRIVQSRCGVIRAATYDLLTTSASIKKRLQAQPVALLRAEKGVMAASEFAQPHTKTPEEWLAAAEGQKRGRFKVFLGYAPGVGKTFSMLSEAMRRKSRGEDIVIGIVETHGRARTAELAAQLEQVPRKQMEYKGTLFEEMDVEAILARRPEVVLIDELAHTNI